MLKIFKRETAKGFEPITEGTAEEAIRKIVFYMQDKYKKPTDWIKDAYTDDVQSNIKVPIELEFLPGRVVTTVKKAFVYKLYHKTNCAFVYGYMDDTKENIIIKIFPLKWDHFKLKTIKAIDKLATQIFGMGQVETAIGLLSPFHEPSINLKIKQVDKNPLLSSHLNKLFEEIGGHKIWN